MKETLVRLKVLLTTGRVRQLARFARDRLADIISQKGEMAFTVRIGPETGVPEMADCSIVTATYSTGSGRQGTIGVIGPTRMRYSRVLSVMNTMGQQLSEMFGSQAPQKNKKLDK